MEDQSAEGPYCLRKPFFVPVDQERIQNALFTTRWEFVSYETTETLISFLTDRLPHIPSSSWELRLRWGGVFVNGLPAYENQVLPLPVRVEYFEPKFDIEKIEEYYPVFSSSWILYQDDFILACYKPPRLASLPVREQLRWNLRTYIEEYLGHPVHMPSRLDTSTSGIVLMSIHPEAHRPLQHLFERRGLKKYYRLRSHVTPSWSQFSHDGPIGKHPGHLILRSVGGPNSRAALTDFRVIQQLPNGNCLIEAIPKTGRTHQIRVHASSLGIPIMGDNFYQGTHFSELCLTSYAIEFPHPVLKESLSINLPARFVPGWLSDHTAV